jgi:hypothetical protein
MRAGLYQRMFALVVNCHISRDVIDFLQAHGLKCSRAGAVRNFFTNEKMGHPEFLDVIEFVTIKTDNFILDSIVNIKQSRKRAWHGSGIARTVMICRLQKSVYADIEYDLTMRGIHFKLMAYGFIASYSGD